MATSIARTESKDAQHQSGSYRQDERPLWVETSLGSDALLLYSFEGTEQISAPFSFRLHLLSEDPHVDTKALLRTPVTVGIQRIDDSARYLNGYFRQIRQLHQDKALVHFEAEIVPWFWFLNLRADCRIFQNKSIPEIVQAIFDELGFAKYRFQLYGSYSPRTYCVQYRETTFNFISRLLEEEGIFYFFTHTEDEHTMVLSDQNTAFPYCPVQKTARYGFAAGPYQEDDVILDLEQERQVRTGRVSLTDFDFTKPNFNLAANLARDDQFEVYDYPGNYVSKDEGDRYAKIRLQEQEVSLETIEGRSNIRVFASGHKFELAEHYRSDLNRHYVLRSVSHRATGNDYRSELGGFTYENTFTAVPFDCPFRPPRVAMKPVVYGSQTATVVGPSGEEIYTDNYGRVKVQFHWDRQGKRDANSSCWVRVSHPWAGKGWGSVSIPRIGQEVVVDFLEGNPDQPLITGRVYNAGQMPPYPLPAGGVVSGIKSNSTKGGGGYNEISMNDTKGKEMVTIHAQYDMSTTVEHDDTQTVVTGNRKIEVQTGTHTESIKGDTSITIVTGNHSLDVQTGTHTHHVKAKVTENYDDEQATTVDKAISITSKTSNIHVTADNDEIVLKSGLSQLVMRKDGTIEITGKSITLTGTEKVKLISAKTSVECNPQMVHNQGPKINSTAIGMHEISGALVKIN